MPSRSRDLFFEVFEALPRQGPGNRASTQRALETCRGLPAEPRVLDLGCGGGAQTLHLASLLPRANILAVDAHAPLVEQLQAAVAKCGLADRVEARVGDMAALEEEPGSFDLVWSEGALYNLGLERALPLCAGYLRPGGYLAFTDAVWRTGDAPAIVREAFEEYPTMGRVEDVLALLERDNWQGLGHFDLPAEAWWDDFYTPMEERIATLRNEHAGDDEALAVLDTLAAEPAMHRDHGHHYGYVFFTARRDNTTASR